MFVALTVLALCLFIYYQLIIPFLYWKKKDIFYVTPWSRFYEVYLNRRSFADLIRQLYEKYPNKRYYGSYQFLQPSLFVRDLDLIKQITVKDFDYFTDHFGFVTERTDPILGLNLFSLKGQKWRAMRSTISPTFTSSKMKMMYNLIQDTALSFLDHFLKSKKIVKLDVKDAYSKYTNDVIANCAFGIKLDSVQHPNNDFFRRGNALQSTNLLLMVKGLLYGFFPKLFETFRIPLVSPEITEFFEKLIKDTITIREKNNIRRPDMVNILMEAKKEQSILNEDNDKSLKQIFLRIDDNIITAQALVFFIAGFTTTSSLLSFLSYELALKPEIQQRLLNEIIENLDETGHVPYDILLKMKYLNCVVSEGLRKWPPGYILNRVCVKDYVIEPRFPDEKRVIIDKGCLVAIPVIAIHHCKNFYQNPDQFDPDRFSDENNIVPGSYIPFGIGPRNCIGSRFALLEIKTLLVALLLKFEIICTEKTQIPLKLAKTLTLEAKDGVWLGLKPRDQFN